MIEVKAENGVTKVKCDGSVMEITTELIEIATHVMEELVAGQSDSIKEIHVDMFCTVLRETLEEQIL